MKTWKFWMQPRNSKSAPIEEILVQARDINEATSKAVSRRPGHIWLQHEEVEPELTPEELNAEIAEDLDPGELPAAGWTRKETKGRPWTPTRREGEELTLSQIVTEAIGTGSMCWKETPKGIFDSIAAEWVADGAVAAIDKHFAALYPKLELDKPFDQGDEDFDRYKRNQDAVGIIEVEPKVDQAGFEGWAADVECEPAIGMAEESEPHPEESLVMLQQKASKRLDGYPSEVFSIVHEFMTRAFNAGYEAHGIDQQLKINRANAKSFETGPQAPSRHDQEVEDLHMEITRRDDILRLIEQTTELQQPFGSDLANFRRRILLLVRA